MTNDFTFLADSHERLDRFLARSAGLGLRAARRMAERGAVSVEGVARPPAFKLRPGQRVEAVRSLPGEAVAQGPACGQESGPRLLAAGNGYAAFFKPAGLHTAALAGGDGPSLEALLPVLHSHGPVVLVNRLDRDTSGIVLGALTQDGAARFRELEGRGEVDKRYLALVRGLLETPVVLRDALDTKDRAVTRVLDGSTTDSLRWTKIRPLAALSRFTLVEARIAKGARHQIRAHLAGHGFPILGDALYGQPGEGLRLHHWRLALPGFCAVCLPDWPEINMPKLQALVECLREENPCQD